MKRNPSLRRLALFSAFVLPTSLSALEVHEWGTFTVLVSSEGRTVNWYQTYSDIAELPPFTLNLMLSKRAYGIAPVRMETPVIYFYPEKEMNVQARVAFINGQITERFPSASDGPFQSSSSINATWAEPLNSLNITPCVVLPKTSDQIFDTRLSGTISSSRQTVTYWSGKLLPPDHADAKLIPSVAGHKGENYGAAREVPDAWIFHSDKPNLSFQDQQTIHPVEKFIFYRGVGQSVPPYSAAMPNNQTVSFSSYGDNGSSFQIALRVKDDQATWVKMPNIPAMADHTKRSSLVSFPEKSISLEQADKELSALFVTELISRGLTEAEAKAMVKTWNHTWFNEPGQRVFTIVDRDWVDSILPLAISPNPEKIERVFVARYEIISPETEQKLASILRQDPSSDQAVSDFKSLKLGRFGSGAAEIIAEQEKRKALSQFSTFLSNSKSPQPR